MTYSGGTSSPTPIAYLPVITVEVAFAPTDINSLTQTWTDCTQYVRRFNSKRGRQHFLDRNEASTFDVMLYNRDGFFTNGSVNGTGNTLRARLPIRVSASLSATISTITVVGTVATANLVSADLTNTQSGDTIVISGNSNSALNGTWTIQSASGSTATFTVPSGTSGGSGGTMVIYYPVFWGLIDNIQEQVTDSLNSDLSVQASDYLKNLSLRYLYAANLYGSYVTLATASGLSLATAGAINWYRFDTNSTYAGTANDQISDAMVTAIFSGNNGAVVGATNQDQQGVCLYDDRTCLDLTAGTGNPSGSLSISPNSTICLDFWILGSGIADQQITNGLTITGGTGDGDLLVTHSGQLGWNGDGTFCPQVINDGQWHHVAIVADWSGGNVILGVDGQWTTTSTPTVGIVSVGGLQIGQNVVGANSLSALIDQVVITGVPHTGAWTATVQAQMAARAAVGALLMHDSTPGDMIAQTLIIAGFGSIATTGTTAYYSVPRYSVDEVAYSNNAFYTQTPNYGVMRFQGYTGNVVGSSAMDVITTVCDTEIGDFFQDNLGMFNFHTRAYPYAASRATATYSFGDQLSSDYWYNPDNLQLTWDDADIWTTVKISVQNGTTQVYENTAAEATQGYSTLTKSTNATTLDQALATAQYLGYLYESGLPRVVSMELKARTDAGSQLPAMLAAYLNNRVHFTRTMPNANPNVSVDMIIEAITDEFDAEAGDWTTTFTLDPYPLRIETQDSKHYMIADDATYGTTDGTNVAI